jgi:hypothetical protein
MGNVSLNYWLISFRKGNVLSLASLIAPVTNLLEKWIPDADTKQKLAFEIATLSDRYAQELTVAQIKLNTAEAKGNWFQSSWRPATGWVCVLGFGVNFLVSPIAAGFGVVIPQADTSVMMPVLMGLLGLGGLRSYEKSKGIQGQ